MTTITRYKFHDLKLRAAFTAVMAVVILAFIVSDATAATKRQQAVGRNSKKEFTVVIDAGHGGHDHGAIDNGAREKDINLGVAKRLSALINKKLKDVKVVMTRDDDTFVSLQERANIANRNKGNLFISIHTNSVDKNNPNRKSVSGASVYALGPQKDANNLQVAQRENSVIELEDNYNQKYSGFDPSKDESYIIFEMAQKKNLGQSLRFADKAQKELVSTASRKDRGVKQAGFWVLWATSMPAVLVELDFICNPVQAEYLNSDRGQQELAEALFNALKQYVESYQNPTLTMAYESQPENSTVASAESDAKEQVSSEGVRSLVSPKKDETTKREHLSTTRQARNPINGARKRRSDSSRKISDTRVVETESITLKNETEYLARQEETPKVENPPAEKNNEPANKKGKKKKVNHKKGNAAKKSDNKSPEPTRTIAGANGETKQDISAANKNGQHNENSAHSSDVKSKGGKTTFTLPKQPAGGNEMYYTIQLLASERELAQDDKKFCGLVPSDMFVENGFYKYTYGKSSNRREIEQKLLEVKTLIPEATIVVRFK